MDTRLWPEIDNGRVATKNNSGFMFSTLSDLSRLFIEHAKTSRSPVLDIGCAYGVSILPILESDSRCDVVALDACQEHLDILQRSVPEAKQGRLSLVNATLPDEFPLPKNHFGAIQISFLLQAFRGGDLQKVLKQCFDALEIGGKLYIYTASIYFKFWCDTFSEIYEQRAQNGVEWPGEMENQYEYLPPEFKSSEEVLSAFMHVFKREQLCRVLSDVGFDIEKSYYDDIKGVDGYESEEKGMISIVAAKRA